MPRLLRNMLLTEALIATVVIGILASMLISRLTYYQEAAEKANMEMTVSAVKSALRMRIAELMIQGRAHEYPGLAQQNPMDWLEKKPTNYLGELPDSIASKPERGNWYFDSTNKILVYYVNQGAYFNVGRTGEQIVRLQIALLYDPPVVPGQNVPVVSSARLKILQPYTWF